jgi:hypothetical protein
MSKDMLGSVVRAAVGVPQHRLDTLAKIASAMAEDNPSGESYHEHFKQLLEIQLIASSHLFERVEEFSLYTTSLFTAAEKFRIGETIDGITVGDIGLNFKEHFLLKVEKGEDVIENFTVNKLMKKAKDSAIIASLGGKRKAEVTLGNFWDFLKTADRQFCYAAYIRDIKGTLLAVRASWLAGDLEMGTVLPHDPPDYRDADIRFLSHSLSR